MGLPQIIQVTFEFWGIIFCLVSCGIIIANKKRKVSVDKDILGMELSGIVLFLSDSLAWLFMGQPGRLGFYIEELSNLFVYVGNFAILGFFARFCKDSVGKDGEKPETLFRIIIWMSNISILLVFLSRFGDFLYVIDEGNNYHRAFGFLFVNAFAVIEALLIFIGVIRDRKRLRKNVFVSIMMFFVLPTMGTIVQLFYYGISHQTIALVISMQIIFAVREVNVRNELSDTTGALEDKAVALEKSLENTKLQNEVIGAISKIYEAIYKIDLNRDLYMEISSGDDISTMTGVTGSARGMLKQLVDAFVDEEYKESTQKFFDLDTLQERLNEQETCSHQYLAMDGDWQQVRFIAKKRDENGVVVDVLCVCHLISAEKKKELNYQKELIKAAEETKIANASKMEFLSHMSHDIRTPINGIRGMLDIAEKNMDDRNRIDDCIHKIRRSSDYLLSLVNDCLEMSRLDSGKEEFSFEPFSLTELVDNLQTMHTPLAAERGITLRKTFENITHDTVIGSKIHVERILSNIINNAVKYNKPNGSIDINISETVVDKEFSSFHFVIQDTGIGMSEEFMEKLFEPFTQEHNDARTKYNGTGLGMSIVKNVVERLCGNIQVESTLGEGSTFTIDLTFEVSNEVTSTAAKKIIAGNDNIEGVRILLVEDNELNLEIAEYVLQEAGAITTSAENGQIAVDMFTKEPPGTYDMILMDVMMPVMNGLEATRAIRALEREDAKKIPIIAMTANAFDEDVKKCRDAGMNKHLAKPLNAGKLVEAVAEYKDLFAENKVQIDYNRYGLEKNMLNELKKLNISFVFQPVMHGDGKTIFAYQAFMRPKNIPVSELIYRYNLEKKLHLLQVATVFGAAQAYRERGYEGSVIINCFQNEKLKADESEIFKTSFGYVSGRPIYEVSNAKQQLLGNEEGLTYDGELYSSRENADSHDLSEQVEIIRIPKLFVENIDTDLQKQETVKTLLEKYHSKNLKVLATGVEREEECLFLQSIGVDYLQGFYLGLPM